MRLPGRNVGAFNGTRRVEKDSSAYTADLLVEHGYRIFGWDLEWRLNGHTGSSDQTVGQVFNRIKTRMGNKTSVVPNNVVLLLHDDMFQNPNSVNKLSALLDSLSTLQDYSFEFIEDYPKRY